MFQKLPICLLKDSSGISRRDYIYKSTTFIKKQPFSPQSLACLINIFTITHGFMKHNDNTPFFPQYSEHFFYKYIPQLCLYFKAFTAPFSLAQVSKSAPQSIEHLSIPQGQVSLSLNPYLFSLGYFYSGYFLLQQNPEMKVLHRSLLQTLQEKALL